MEPIHPFVRDLIDPLLSSRLYALGDLVVTRIAAAEAPVGGEGEENDPFAPPPGETAGARGRRQLKLADAVVQSVLGRELALIDRNLALTRELSRRELGRGGPAGLEMIVVGDSEGRTGGTGALAGEHLLTGARRERFQKLAEAWRRGVDRTRERLEADGDR